MNMQAIHNLNASNSSEHAATPTQSSLQHSRFKPAIQGVILGAIAGRFLPKISPFSGAIIGLVSAKIYQKRQAQCR